VFKKRAKKVFARIALKLVYTFKKVKTLYIPLHQSCAENLVTKAFIPDSLSSNLNKSSI